MVHHDPFRQTPTRPDPRAVARERLAARSRRLRTLRLRAGGGAVGVFLAAWVALFVPAQQAAGTSGASPAASTAASSAATVDETTQSQETYDSGAVEDSLDTAEADATAADEATTAVEATPATTSQS